jgi:hypothetical protein
MERTTLNKGFSIFEMLISITLFTLVWIALIGNVVVGKASEVRSRHIIQAAYQAQKEIERLRRAPYHSLNIYTTPHTVVIDDRGTPTGADDTIGNVTFTTAPIATPLAANNVTRVVVQITWRERLPVRGTTTANVRLGTYLCEDPRIN